MSDHDPRVTQAQEPPANPADLTDLADPADRAARSGRDHDARAEILSRVRAALDDRPPAPPVRRAYRRERGEGVDVVRTFAERAADYRANVVRASPFTMLDDVVALLSARGARRMAVPAGRRLGWLDWLPLELVGDDPPLTVDQLEALDGVVTGCALAIAETGTVVLDGGDGCGRRVLTLVPDYHLCVVRPDQIVATVPEAVARLDPRAPQTWISGPSATSDIELSRVEGVHGPRNLDILILG